MIQSRRFLFFAALCIAAVSAAVGLIPRLSAERANKTVAFVVENRDIVSLAYQSGKSSAEVLDTLTGLGVVGVTVAEYTGEELMNLNPMPIKFGAAGALGVDVDDAAPDRAAVVFNEDMPYTEHIYEYLSIKLPGTRKINRGDEIILILPGTADHFRQSAFVPDFKGLDVFRANDVPMLFRPGPCLAANGERVAQSLKWLIERYPQIKNIIPSGMIMAGNPDFAPIVKVLKENGVTFTHVEFFNQIGAGAMTHLMAPDILPLHSLTREEVISRKMTRQQIRERFTRAVHERSIRLLIMRPYDLQMGGRLPVFIEDLDVAKRDIEARGFSFGWPRPLLKWPVPLAGAFACAISFLFCFWSYATRCLGVEDGKTALKERLALIALSLVSAGLLWKIPALSRLAGGFGAAFIATEAALAAMDYCKKPAGGLIAGLFIVAAGGLSIASFYGTSAAALRLTPFSGVKLTLLLPPILILLHDFRRKIHPESISEIVVRPAIWGELVLIGAVMLGMLVMLLRSDNVSTVPALEVAFRGFMERALVVRPRTKEFLIGYPALILYYYLIKRNWAVHYRESLRLVASLAFSSAINTFCHFHTILPLSVIRVFNGWWVGIAIGLSIVALMNLAGIPLWKKGVREVFR